MFNLIGSGLAFYLVNKFFNPTVSEKKFKLDNSSLTNETFDHFYGGAPIKKYLREVLAFMKDPELFENFGLRLRRGILFHGPPGTGKTMLARILANEAGLAFISASASEFEEIFVGVGPKRIRDIFEEARKKK